MKRIVIFILLVIILLASAAEERGREVERYNREEEGQRYSWPGCNPQICCGAMSVNAISWLVWLLVAGVGMLVMKFNINELE